MLNGTLETDTCSGNTSGCPEINIVIMWFTSTAEAPGAPEAPDSGLHASTRERGPGAVPITGLAPAMG